MSTPAPRVEIGVAPAAERPPLLVRVLIILWPAFVMAGVLDAQVFVVVDPGSLSWWGYEPISWSHNAVYTVTFLLFWGGIATSAAITHLLEQS